MQDRSNPTAFTANFGSISTAQDSRQLQFALKLLFYFRLAFQVLDY
ncbi:MAG: hypothetical protein M3N41_15130 [Acidobacteriota bacterium]|nr:hypothetical protein [Acidobacteriota bacterium]